jgi:hypothetical protein
MNSNAVENERTSDLRRPVPLQYHAESDRVWYVRSQHVFAIEMIAIARAMELLEYDKDAVPVYLADEEEDAIETTIEVPHFFGSVTAVAHFVDVMASFDGCVSLKDMPKRARIGSLAKWNALLAKWLRFCDDVARGIESGAELKNLLDTVWAKEPPEPGFYAVGNDDTFLVTHAGEVLEVVRGGMDGPVVTRVTALPVGVGCELMDGAAWLPSVVLQAARIVGVFSPLLDLADGAVDVLDEVLFGGGQSPCTTDMDLRRDGLVAVEGDRLQLTSRCRRLLAELCTILTRGPLLPLVDEEAVG